MGGFTLSSPYEPAASVSSGSTTDDEYVVLTLSESGSADTGATPEVTLKASGVTDLAGNARSGDQAAVTSTDGAAPAIDAGLTKDSGEDGQIDTITITFSEAVNDATVASGDFTLSGSYTVSSWDTGTTTDDATVDLTIGGGSAGDTEARPDITLSTGGVADGGGNTRSSAYPAVQAEDGAAAYLESAETDDADGDGQIDTLRLTFSEAVDDGSVSSGGFTLSSPYSVTATGTGDIGSDADVELMIAGDGSADTGAMPEVTLKASGVSDLAGNARTTSDQASVTSLDLAEEILVSVTGTDQGTSGLFNDENDKIEFEFSEDLDDSSIPNHDELEAYFEFYDGGSSIDGDNFPVDSKITVAIVGAKLTITKSSAGGNNSDLLTPNQDEEVKVVETTYTTLKDAHDVEVRKASTNVVAYELDRDSNSSEGLVRIESRDYEQTIHKPERQDTFDVVRGVDSNRLSFDYESKSGTREKLRRDSEVIYGKSTAEIYSREEEIVHSDSMSTDYASDNTGESTESFGSLFSELDLYFIKKDASYFEYDPDIIATQRVNGIVNGGEDDEIYSLKLSSLDSEESDSNTFAGSLDSDNNNVEILAVPRESEEEHYNPLAIIDRKVNRMLLIVASLLIVLLGAFCYLWVRKDGNRL